MGSKELFHVLSNWTALTLVHWSYAGPFQQGPPGVLGHNMRAARPTPMEAHQNFVDAQLVLDAQHGRGILCLIK